MAIKEITIEELTEELKDFGVDPTNFCGHYSDLGLKLRKIGTDELYDRPIDVLPCLWEYEEINQ